MKSWIPASGASLLFLVMGAGAALALTSNVSIRDNFYTPRNDTVLVGDAVKWTNIGSGVHTTTSDGGLWNSGSMGFGATFTRTFSGVGSFPYHCLYHGTAMSGIVVVIGATPSPPSSWGKLKRVYRKAGPPPRVGAESKAAR